MKSISTICIGLVLFAGSLSPVQAQTKPEYCRIATFEDGSKQYWPILAFDPATADSGNGFNYDIIADWVPAKRHIDDDDRMRVIASTKVADEMDLAHTGTNGKRKARLTLKMDSTGLWAKGTTTIGTYVIYRLDDAPNCQHDYADWTKSCKAFHFEYFLPGATTDLPKLGTNVVRISDQYPCKETSAQEDEGDGHHGPD